MEDALPRILPSPLLSIPFRIYDAIDIEAWDEPEGKNASFKAEGAMEKSLRVCNI